MTIALLILGCSAYTADKSDEAAFDAVTPGNLSRRIFDEGNVAAAIMAGAFVIAVSIVIAASIHS